MTKVKVVCSSVNGSGTGQKKKLDNFAPSRKANGKIQKNRKDVNGEDFNALNDYINKCVEVQAKTRVCFVNIKRNVTMSSSTGSSSVNISDADDQCTSTLLAQYKNGAQENRNTSCIAGTPTSFVSSQQKALLEEQSAGGPKMQDIDRNINDMSYKHTSRCRVNLKRIVMTFPTNGINNVAEVTTKTGAAIRKCFVKLRKVSPTQAAEELVARKKAKDALLASQIISPILDHEKRKAFRKLSLTSPGNTEYKDHELATVAILKNKNPEHSEPDNSASNIETISKPAPYPRQSLRLLRAGVKNFQTSRNSITHSEFAGNTQNKIKAKDTKSAKSMAAKIPLKEINVDKSNALNRGRENQIADIESLKVPFNKSSIRGKENQTEPKKLYDNRKPESNGRMRKNNEIVKNDGKTASSETTEHNLKKCKVRLQKRTVLPTENKCMKYSPIKPPLPQEISEETGNQMEETSVSSKSFETPTVEHADAVNKSLLIKFSPQRNSTTWNVDEGKCGKNPADGKVLQNIEDFRKPERPSSTRQIREHLKMTAKETRSVRNNVINAPTTADFQPQGNSTKCLELMGDLTVLKSNDDAVQKGSANSSTQHRTNVCNKTNKFFHRHEGVGSQEAEKHHKVSPIGKRQRLLSKRSSQVRREQVYEFLSQSQTSDSGGLAGSKQAKHPDPAADIIKKLINEGKVAVATNRKGTGRPIMKRIIKKPHKAAANKVVKAKVTGKKPLAKRKNKQTVRADAEDYRDNLAEDHFMDNDDDDILHDEIGNSNISNVAAIPSVHENSLRHSKVDQEGTFSNLAKSVLINQAGRTDLQRLKAQRLLAMAKKLISTPKNKNIPSIEPVDFSPIPRPATKPSPWRVDEDNHLPRVFNFSRSSGNLPSFSSDFIPPTPRKEKPNNSNTSQQVQTKVSESKPSLLQTSPLPLIEGISSLPDHFSTTLANNLNSGIPSFSSNDSNAENKTPPDIYHDLDSQTNAENDNIFNLKQLPNPRRNLNYRSPLKTINIMEVVHLPPLQISKFLSGAEKPLKPTDRSELLKNSNFKTPQKPAQKKLKTIPNNDLFGFEEFLSQSGLSSQEDSQSESDFPHDEQVKNAMHEKLLGLRKFKPDSTDLEMNLQQTVANKERVEMEDKYLFKEAQRVAKSQKTVKEMLIPTRLYDEKPTSSRKSLEEQKRVYNTRRREEESNTSEMLFQEIEPETTFNEEDPHRTYIRPHKRKRRLREDRLIFAFDSDESDFENDSGGKKRVDNKSHETTDSSIEQLPTKKKKRKPKENPELVHFVEDFNEMCKEVENYELVVEKSA